MIEPIARDPHELTAKLAYQYWEGRGSPLGSPEIDWLAAEKDLGFSGRDSRAPLRLYGLSMEAYEGPYR